MAQKFWNVGLIFAHRLLLLERSQHQRAHVLVGDRVDFELSRINAQVHCAKRMTCRSERWERPVNVNREPLIFQRAISGREEKTFAPLDRKSGPDLYIERV
jgi:hypothetical protein